MKDRERLSRPAFDLNATNACKGVALILLLWHHLFYKHPEFGPLVHTSALLAKVCVAMFVFLSGYGFAESVRARKFELLRFYRTRLVPLYANYWLIAALFVSLGVWVMGVSLESAYTDHPYGKFLVQMTGLHRYAFPEYGYNATWWYMSVIIPLVLLFPAFWGMGALANPRRSSAMEASMADATKHGGTVRIEDEFDAVDFVLEIPAGAPASQDAQLSVEQAQRYARDMAQLMARSMSKRVAPSGADRSES